MNKTCFRVFVVLAASCFPFSAASATVVPTQQAYVKLFNPGVKDNFGWSVAVSGDTMVVGASAFFNQDNGFGAAYIFVRNGTNWIPQAYLRPTTAEAYDGFGLSVAISGTNVVVGAPYESSGTNQFDGGAKNSGAAYVFVRTNATKWVERAYLKASNTEAGDHFGISVAVSGDTIVVGADGESSGATAVDGEQSDDSAPSAGAAYVFVPSGTSWAQQAYLKASNAEGVDLFGTQFGDFFGSSVGVSGDTVVVGAWGESSSATGVNGDQNDNSALNAGAAYVFVRSAGIWSQQAYLKASNTEMGDLFGARSQCPEIRS